jgi:peroxiredoxin
MPLIEEAYRRRRAEGFVALGIDFDEPADLVTAFAEELGLSFPLLLDPGGLVQRQYRVVGYPSTVVVDREGRISSYHIGILARSQLDEYLAEAGIGP